MAIHSVGGVLQEPLRFPQRLLLQLIFGSLNCTPGLCARTSMSGTPSEPASLPSVSSSWAERVSVGCLPLGGPARCRLPPLPPRPLPPLPSVLQHGHVSPQALR